MRTLKVSIPEENLVNLVCSQLNFHFPDHLEVNVVTLKHCVKNGMLRIQKCFDPIILKYYGVGNESYFNHLHGDHYSMFLYFVSNEAYWANDEVLASKLFLLNKSLFGIDAFYAIKLPEHFLFVHPLGTILGNAQFEDFLVVYQGVTVGATTSGIYPTFSDQTILYSNSSIIGDCKIGSNFVLAANASLVNSNVPANKVVVGNFPSHLVLENKNNLISNYFKF
jgi:serine O-acetyltransferase